MKDKTCRTEERRRSLCKENKMACSFLRMGVHSHGEDGTDCLYDYINC